MWHTEIELEWMGCECYGRAYHRVCRGRNKQMMVKKLSLGTLRFRFSKEIIRSIKPCALFTHLSVIHIFRLRPGPDVRQIPANPREMVWPNLPQSMWPRLESRRKRRNVCLRLSVLCISSLQMWTSSNAAAFQMFLWLRTTIWSKGCHVKYFQFPCSVGHRKLLHQVSAMRTATLHYIRIHKGETWTTPTSSLYMMTSLW